MAQSSQSKLSNSVDDMLHLRDGAHQGKALRPGTSAIRFAKVPFGDASGFSDKELELLNIAVLETSKVLKVKPPGFFAVQVRRTNPQTLAKGVLTLTCIHKRTNDTASTQALIASRKTAAQGSLLGYPEDTGPHGERFWTRVALRMPRRTPDECLDAFLAARRSPVARFSSSGRTLEPY